MTSDDGNGGLVMALVVMKVVEKRGEKAWQGMKVKKEAATNGFATLN